MRRGQRRGEEGCYKTWRRRWLGCHLIQQVVVYKSEEKKEVLLKDYPIHERVRVHERCSAVVHRERGAR